jgi:hypothetical protein
MEEIYTLLQERIESVDEVKKKAVPLDTALSIADSDKEIKDSDIADLTHAIGQAKRLEKFRIIKENELLEVIFGLKCFDNNQKL